MLVGVSIGERKLNQNLEQVYNLVSSGVCFEWMRRPKKQALKEIEISQQLTCLNYVLVSLFSCTTEISQGNYNCCKKLSENLS